MLKRTALDLGTPAGGVGTLGTIPALSLSPTPSLGGGASGDADPLPFPSLHNNDKSPMNVPNLLAPIAALPAVLPSLLTSNNSNNNNNNSNNNNSNNSNDSTNSSASTNATSSSDYPAAQSLSFADKHFESLAASLSLAARERERESDASTPEFRKSKSLTRKLKELSGRERERERLEPTVPQTQTHTIGTPARSAAQPSAPSHMSPPLSAPRSHAVHAAHPRTPLHALKVPALSTPVSSSVAVSTPVSVPAAEENTQFFQHSSLPKSLSSTQGKLSSTHALTHTHANTHTPNHRGGNNGQSIMSTPNNNTNTKINSNITYISSNINVNANNIANKNSNASIFTNSGAQQCVLVERAAPIGTLDRASENDRIVQDRLLQAKALSRRDENGATMHVFSLWRKDKPKETEAESETNAEKERDTETNFVLPGKYSAKLRSAASSLVSRSERDEDGQKEKEGEDRGGEAEDEYSDSFDADVERETDAPSADVSSLSLSLTSSRAAQTLANALRWRGDDHENESETERDGEKVESEGDHTDLSHKKKPSASLSDTHQSTRFRSQSHSLAISLADSPPPRRKSVPHAEVHAIRRTLFSEPATVVRSLTSRDAKEEREKRERESEREEREEREKENKSPKDAKPPTQTLSKYQRLRNLRIRREQLGNNNETIKYDNIAPVSTAVLPTKAKEEEEKIKENEVQREADEDSATASPLLSELSAYEEEEEEECLPYRYPPRSTEGNERDEDVADDDTCASPLQWKKGEVIGEGTFGRVFKGLNEKTGELLAIKQITLADGSQREAEELRREINVMWDLDHPHIVRYLGTTKTDRYLFILMEYVTGGSIASMLKQFGPFTENLLRRLSYHIISGVAYLHDKGIIHRDIKGANILVTDAGVAKLADFGCSKRMVGLCTASLEESMCALKGSVPWMAPEVIKQSGFGRPSDIWSFGATLIEMATGKPPWSEFTNNLATLFHVATSKEPPPIPSHLSAPCAEFMRICLVIDPDARATATELLNESSFLQPERGKSTITNTPFMKKKKEMSAVMSEKK